MSKRYRLNLLKFTGVLIIAAALFLLAFILITTVRLTRQTIYPDTIVYPLPTLETTHPYETVELITSDGLTLRGWYFPPQNGAVIILGHGYGVNEPQFTPEANGLVEHGYGVLMFFWRGWGASEGEMVTLGDKERLDTQAALDWLNTHSEVQHIGALGYSLGATVIAGSAAQDERLEAVILVAAYPDLATLTRDKADFMGFITQAAALWTLNNAGIDVQAVHPSQNLCEISPRPILLIYGTLDTVVPPGTADLMRESACDPYEFWLMEGVDHGSYTHDPGFMERIILFFDQYLLKVSE